MGFFDQIIGDIITKVLTDKKYSELRQAAWKGVKQGVQQGINETIHGTDGRKDPQKSKQSK